MLGYQSFFTTVLTIAMDFYNTWLVLHIYTYDYSSMIYQFGQDIMKV